MTHRRGARRKCRYRARRGLAGRRAAGMSCGAPGDPPQAPQRAVDRGGKIRRGQGTAFRQGTDRDGGLQRGAHLLFQPDPVAAVRRVLLQERPRFGDPHLPHVLDHPPVGQARRASARLPPSAPTAQPRRWPGATHCPGHRPAVRWRPRQSAVPAGSGKARQARPGPGPARRAPRRYPSGRRRRRRGHGRPPWMRVPCSARRR